MGAMLSAILNAMQKTMNAMKKLLREPLVLLFVVTTVLFAWATAVASSGQMTNWEMSLFGTINQMTNVLKWPALILTQFGDIAIICALLLGFLVVGKRWVVGRIFVIIGAITVVSQIAKHVIGRQRPIDLVEPVLIRVQETGLGYPSRHTAVATALGIIIVYSFGRKWLWVACLWTLAVGFTRIYLGVHAPLDVVGGFALGAMIASGLLACEKLWKKLAVKA